MAGNHGRFLFDFSPESVVFRVTDDPAPRLPVQLRHGRTTARPFHAATLLRRIELKDIDPKERHRRRPTLIQTEDGKKLAAAGVAVGPKGVKAACAEAAVKPGSTPKLGLKG